MPDDRCPWAPQAPLLAGPAGRDEGAHGRPFEEPRAESGGAPGAWGLRAPLALDRRDDPAPLDRKPRALGAARDAEAEALRSLKGSVKF